MLTEKQKKMVEAAALQEKLEEQKRKAEIERKHRKTVFEAIMELTDTVEEHVLHKNLPVLDMSSWDEVSEERFLARLCGFPLCQNAVEKRPQQKYKIDRVEKKIFEACTDRLRFCGEVCFARFALVKEQLPAQPLWLTGKKNEIDFILSHPGSPSTSASPGGGITSPSREIEFVPNRTVVSKLNDLFIGDTADSDDEVDEERTKEDEIEHEKEKMEDEEFVSAVRRFVCSYVPGGGGGKTEKMEEKPTTPPAQKLNKNEEEQKLARIREKLKNRPVMNQRRTMLTEAKRLNPVEIRRNIKIEQSVKAATADGEGTALGEPTIEEKVMNKEAVPFTGAFEVVAALFATWLTPRTSEFIRAGGARPVTEIDRMLKRFYAGDRPLEEDFPLPVVDSLDMKRRRMEILLAALKPSWSSMESQLHVRSSRVSDLTAIVASLHLEADGITGFNKKEAKLIVLGFWRIACMLSDELEADFYPNGALSGEVRTLLEFWQLDDAAYLRLIEDIQGRLSTHDVTRVE